MVSPATVNEWSPARRLALGAVLLLGALWMVPGAIHAAYHCDEVNVFRHVTNFAHGDFSAPGRPGLLWLVLVPTVHLGDATSSIHALRATAVAASGATLLLVGVLAALGLRRESPAPRDETPDAGVWAILGAGGLLATSLGWQTHAFEVRTDTYVAPLTLLAAACLLRPTVSTRAAVLAGASMAAAGLVSQKSIYNAGALAAAWLVYHAVASRPLAVRDRLRTAAVAVGTALALVACWYGGMEVLAGGSGFLKNNLDTAVSTGFSEVWSFERNLGTVGETARRAPALWALAIPGLVAAAVSRRRRAAVLAVGVLGAVMVSTIAVHRGFRPYFVASFEPYIAVVSGAFLGSLCAGLHRKLRTLPRAASAGIAALPLVLALTFTAHTNREGSAALLSTDNEHQLRVVREAVTAFPEPVPYWDSIGLVPGYPETTFFGTGPTRTAKRRKSPGNMFVKLAREKKPRFFIRDYMTRDGYLRPDERAWVWRHYLPYRANLHLLGGRIRVGETSPAQGVMEVLVAGKYTVRFLGDWTGAATVDGAEVHDGDVVTLAEGSTRLAAVPESGDGDLALYLGVGRSPENVGADWSMYPRLRRDRFQQYDRRGKPADLLTPEHDPSMTPKKHSARTRRHSAWRADRREDLATP